MFARYRVSQSGASTERRKFDDKVGVFWGSYFMCFCLGKQLNIFALICYSNFPSRHTITERWNIENVHTKIFLQYSIAQTQKNVFDVMRGNVKAFLGIQLNNKLNFLNDSLEKNSNFIKTSLYKGKFEIITIDEDYEIIFKWRENVLKVSKNKIQFLRNF